MKTYEYRTDWIKDHGDDTKVVLPIPNATNHLNQLAAEGWEPISITPGTNGQTYAGLFITLRRQSN